MPILLASGGRVVIDPGPGDGDFDGGIQFVQNATLDYDRATHTVIPAGFGVGEFTFEVVVDPSQINTIGQTLTNPGQFTNWANESNEVGSSPTWWQPCNFLLDGHNNNDNGAGTFDLMVYNSGVMRWLFGDGDASQPTGGVWGIQNTSGTNILDGNRHYIACIRRWQSSPANSADLELWVDGVLQATVNTGSRTNMATAYWDAWTGFPAGQGQWMWGAEKFAALDPGDWADYKGILRSLAFFSGAKSSSDLQNNYANAVNRGHADYVDDFAFGEGSGTTTTSENGVVMALTNPGDFWPAPVMGTLVTSLSLTNTIASARNGRVEMFGQAFARGDVLSSDTLAAWVDSASVPLQFMRETSWPDGSLQYAVLAVVAGDFTSSQTKTLELRRDGAAPSGSNITLANLPADGASNADLTLGAETITCNRTNLQAGSVVQVLSGPHLAHWIYRPAYSSPARVYARFDIYAHRVASSGAVDYVEYAGGNEVTQIRRDEQDHGSVASALNRFRVNGVNVLSETTQLFQYSRWWEHDFDTDIHVIHDADYLQSTGVLWRYLDGFNVTAQAVTDYQTALNNANTINGNAGWREDMSAGGSSPDIGPIPGQDVCYLLGQSVTMRDTMMRMHQRWGRHQIHFWDEDQARPVQIGPNAGQHSVSGLNPDLGFNAYWGSFPSASWTTAGTDSAHLPRCGFMPYVLSGRDWYLEEMQFWASMCTGSGTGGYINSTDYNILSHDQIRAEGWALSTVAVAAALTPAGATKTYFEGALNRHETYTWQGEYAPDATPSGQNGWNMLGMLRTTTPQGRNDVIAQDRWYIPWQNDFVALGATWAYKLGYDGTNAALPDYSEYSDWLLKNTVGRINQFGFQSAALYWTDLGADTADPQTWSQLREILYNSNEVANDDQSFRPNAAFQPYDQVVLRNEEHGSLAWRQAWSNTLAAADSVGYTTEPASDILITWAAISAAVERGVEGAVQARTEYITISNKPNTSTGGIDVQGQPQFDLAPEPTYPIVVEGPGAWIQTNIGVSSAFTNITANLQRTLQIHNQAEAFSGGGCGGGFMYVLGGGHNNGMNDAVAVLDLRRLDSLGWVEEIESTADYRGVSDTAYNTIGAYLNAEYDASDVVGGVRDSRGLVALSRHTYDSFDVLENGDFYMFGGVMAYDNTGQPNPAWQDWESDLWKYTRGVGYSYLGRRSAIQTGLVTSSLCIDWLDSNRLWVRDDTGLYAVNLTTGSFGAAVTNGGNWGDESWMRFNEDDGSQGTIACGGSFGGGTWTEYDIALNTWSAGRAFPPGGNTTFDYVFYVPARYGANYGAYFCYTPTLGQLWRWNGSAWSSIATGGPTASDWVYGRAGFDEVHEVFYVNVYEAEWRTWMVRPYAFD